MFDWLGSETWTHWRESITAVGGLVALSIATRTYLLNSRSKREEHPRLVFSRISSIAPLDDGDEYEFPDVEPFYAAVSDAFSPGSGRATAPALVCAVDVFNRSKEVIGPVWVRLAYSHSEWENSPGKVVPVIAPDSTLSVFLVGPNEAEFGRYTLKSLVVFRDSAGYWWERNGTDPIRQLRVEPRLGVTHEDAPVSSGFRAISLGDGRAFSAFPAWKTWLFDRCLSRVPVVGPSICNGKWRSWMERRAELRLMRQPFEQLPRGEATSSEIV